MKQLLNDNERNILNELVVQAEEKTRAQIVLAVIKRCDNYAEIPWKAFAIGASCAGFAVYILDMLTVRWITDTLVLFSVIAILATGALFSLLTVIFPRFTGLFISKSRRESETLQYAESLFLSRELFATEGRRGILLLISKFERQVCIIPDIGVRSRFTGIQIKRIISKMTPFLRKDEVKNALETGLEEIIEILCPPLSTASDRNELPNEIIEEEGV